MEKMLVWVRFGGVVFSECGEFKISKMRDANSSIFVLYRLCFADGEFQEIDSALSCAAAKAMAQERLHDEYISSLASQRWREGYDAVAQMLDN